MKPVTSPGGSMAGWMRRALLRWYDENRRDLPWRRTRDPYAIWVSEIMLQQTQVAKVIGYYERWMVQFPTLEVLARATESDALRAWEGLGYYSRARALLNGARAVVDRHGGRVPTEVSALRELPGVGPYTAGAIASIAFGRDEPVVDGNVKRVLCRLFELRGDPSCAPLAPELWERARALLPHGRAGDFNQAIMELGARVCTPRAPRCSECPLSRRCAARALDVAQELPESRARPRVIPLEHAAAVCTHETHVLLVKIPDAAPRWAGLWQFPTVELRAGEAPDSTAERAALELTGMRVTADGRLGALQHSVTRYRITLTAIRCAPATLQPAADRGSVWQPIPELEALPMPAAQRTVAGWVGGTAPARSARRAPGHRSGRDQKSPARLP